ncbi:MAG: adenylate/guanylate cyclase domain-containing protein [Pseudomonadota bacterium]
MSAVRSWLNSLQLGQYADVFEENAIELSHLEDLDHEILREMGVKAAGHRITLLKAAAKHESEANRRNVSSAGEAEDVSNSVGNSSAERAERRQLTVMFADLVGSTELSRRLDIEDLRALNRAYQEVAATTIEQFGGVVARYMGDGVLAYFGYPRAHEDDAERAIRAGLALTQAVSGINIEALTRTSLTLEARVGIATGPVVVGDLIGTGQAQEMAAVGETPNLAARVESSAVPGSVAVASSTRSLTERLFRFASMGLFNLKGFDDPIELWRVDSELRVESRFKATRGRYSTALVGRIEELALLQRRWKAILDREGHAIFLCGEAGIGKSRLVQELHKQLPPNEHEQLLLQCSPHHTNSPLYPFAAQLKDSANLTPIHGNAENYRRLSASLEQVGCTDDDSAALAELLGLARPQTSADKFGNLAPRALRERVKAALVRQLRGHAKRYPLLLVFEDLHWADPSTLEVIEQVLAELEDTRVLGVFTFRPEFEIPWAGAPSTTLLTLSRLGLRESQNLLRAILQDGVALEKDAVDVLLGRADGIPLFIEELTHATVDEPEADGVRTSLPATLHDALLSRLDRDPLAKQVAQVASVLGRDFRYEVLEAVLEREPDDIRQGLASLVENDLMTIRGELPDAECRFKHALIRDAAYASLLRTARSALHERVALCLADINQTEIELRAHHWREAGAYESAINDYQRAGEHALQRSANVEAIQHLSTALDLLCGRSDLEGQDRREFTLRALLGPALQAIDGFGAQRVVANYERADELAGFVGTPEETFLIRWTRARIHNARGDYDAAIAIGESLRHDANVSKNSEQQLAAQTVLGISLYLSGSLERAHTELARGADLYRPQEHGELTVRYGIDLGMMCAARDALALWYLGYPTQSVSRMDQALQLAEQSKHAMTLTNALEYCAQLHHLRQEPARVHEYSERLIAHCDQQGNVQHRWVGLHLLHAANLDLGISTTQPADIGNPISEWRRGGTIAFVPEMLGTLGAAYIRRGSFEDACRCLSDGLQIAADSSQTALQPELHRLVGEALLIADSPDLAKAEMRFREAIQISRAVGARSLELRAATSLARLLTQRGERQLASEVLTPIYESFEEGFDTEDLRSAQDLLNLTK